MGRREEKRAITRQQMLSAAAVLFAEKGYDSTSIDDIAERADVSKGTFYYHFESKDELVVELRRWSLAGSLEQVSEAKSQGRAPLWILERLLLDRADFTEKQPELSKVFFAQRVQQFLFKEEHVLGQEIEGKPKQLFRSTVYELVCEGQKAGQIRSDLSPQEVAGMIMAFLLHAQGAWLASDRSTSLVEKVHRWFHALLDGVGTRGYREQAPCFATQKVSEGNTAHRQ